MLILWNQLAHCHNFSPNTVMVPKGTGHNSSTFWWERHVVGAQHNLGTAGQRSGHFLVDEWKTVNKLSSFVIRTRLLVLHLNVSPFLSLNFLYWQFLSCKFPFSASLEFKVVSMDSRISEHSWMILTWDSLGMTLVGGL